MKKDALRNTIIALVLSVSALLINAVTLYISDQKIPITLIFISMTTGAIIVRLADLIKDRK